MYFKIAVFFILLSVILSTFVSDSQARSTKGIWVSEQPRMKAHITRDTIRITHIGDDWSALYWKGTWSSKIKKQKRFTSIADRKALESSLFASTLKRKKFVYRNGKISFSYTIFGITQRVYLQKK